jgi:hypothetical protein
MRLTKSFFAAIFLLVPCLLAQSGRRLAVISANGPLARANVLFALGENRVTDSLRGKLASQPGITIIAQKDVDTLLSTQNFQNNDRSSPDTAAKIGKLLGAQQIVLVDLISASQSSHDENSPTSTKTIATVDAEAGARLVDVESGVMLSQFTSTYKNNVVAGEIKRWPILKTTGGDLQGTFADMWTKATDSLTTDLATKIVGVAQSAPVKAEPPVVAGIANGSTYIDEGTKSGIKAGDRFQIIRMVDTHLTDRTGKPIMQKQRVCIFTVASADETNSSGTCQGGVPQKNDVAEPVQP